MKRLSAPFLYALCAALLGLGAPTIGFAQAQVWQVCAEENGVCRFQGDAQVRFGVEGKWTYQNAKNRVHCDVQQFGDPAGGQVKQCQVLQSYTGDVAGVRGSSMGAAGGAVAANWRVCAQENGVCAVSGSTEVRFGIDGRYVTRVASANVACTKENFGDPYPGRVKQCEVNDTTASKAAGTWSVCAAENGVCTVNGTAQVRFGANGMYQYRTVSNSVACNTSIFGDPAYGVPKQCETLTGAASTATASTGLAAILQNLLGRWEFCAPEGGSCNVGNASSVRFGVDDRWMTKQANGTVACTVENFGDPAPHVLKQCYVRR